ncbi:DUF1014-domain-containing protein [Viridothelium virens]|uniref:DUF1014-domain-containing protein n=1 Tax=Viridothelium virens TaxID=1048519 RepID=A0A6A6GW42_VIRVR|nr:DUF1014-domain-containing protein [Viridothelium virens]
MAPRGEVNTKKAAGNAKKAEAAAAKQAEVDRKKAVAEDVEWGKGAKSTAKQDAAAAKTADAARKKAEKDALLAEEEASLPSKPSKGKNAPAKKSRGLDLSGLDAPSSNQLRSVSASNIDDALDALTLDRGGGGSNEQVERHPERRFKAAYAVFEARRLEEMKDEKALRRNQKVERIRKEFEKSPENPFNQVTARFDSTREEVRELQQGERAKTEARLAGPA